MAAGQGRCPLGCYERGSRRGKWAQPPSPPTEDVSAPLVPSDELGPLETRGRGQSGPSANPRRAWGLGEKHPRPFSWMSRTGTEQRLGPERQAGARALTRSLDSHRSSGHCLDFTQRTLGTQHCNSTILKKEHLESLLNPPESRQPTFKPLLPFSILPSSPFPSTREKAKVDS